MRILVADQNAVLLAAITATFGGHCDLVTTTRRDVSIAWVEREKFDVVVACDRLTDSTGLELLSDVARISPGTLRIFAASAERLQRLGSQLDPFGLLGTLSYPISPRKLLNALKEARRRLPPREERKVRHVVLESEWDTGERLGLVESELKARAAQERKARAERAQLVRELEKRAPPAGSAQQRPPSAEPKVRHVVLESEWSTGERPALVEHDLKAQAAKSQVAQEAEAQVARAHVAQELKAQAARAQHVAQELEAQAARAQLAQELEARAAREREMQASREQMARERETQAAWMQLAREREAEAARAEEERERKARAVRAHVAREQARTRARVAQGSDEFVFGTSLAEASPQVEAAPARDGPDHSNAGEPVARAAAPKAPVAPPASGQVGESSNDPDFNGPPPVPRWATDGAANDTAYDGKQAAAPRAQPAGQPQGIPSGDRQHPSQASQTNQSRPAAGQSTAATKSSQTTTARGTVAASQTAERTPSVPTEAQRAAFERALERRNAARAAAASQVTPGKKSRGKNRNQVAEPIKVADPQSAAAAVASLGSMFVEPAIEPVEPSQAAQPLPSKSLAELARMSMTKRPLKERNLKGKVGGGQQRRTMFAAGSGLVVVTILGVLSFELLRTHHEVDRSQPAQTANTQIFSSRAASPDGQADHSPLPFTPTPPQPTQAQPQPPVAAANVPQRQHFNPAATLPQGQAVEHPGAIEPSSM